MTQNKRINTRVYGTIKKYVIDDNGKPVGVSNKNPLLDTRRYEVQYIDGSTEELTANLIVENLLAQVDENGHRQLLMNEILDHRKSPDAIEKEEGTFKRGRYDVKKKTTKQWDLLVSLKVP